MPEAELEFKTYRMSLKDIDDEGQFRGYLSVFNVIDHGGDLVEPGAFRKTLRQTRAFPLLWAHESHTPNHVIGTFGAQEDKHGLLIDGEFFMDQAGGREAHGVAKRLKEKGAKVGLSIGYKVDKSKTEELEGGKIMGRLKEIQLFEGSVTLFPMNPKARIDAIKEGFEQKPYPNEHACRLNDPGKYERFARMKRKHNGKEYSVIIGVKKGGGSEDQAFRYPKATWSAAEARAHCKSHDGSFEAAVAKEIEFRCTNCGETVIVFSDQIPDDKAFVSREPAEAIPGDEPLEEEEQTAALAALENLVRKVKK